MVTDEECMASARECPLTKKRAARAALQYLASGLVPACAPPPAGQYYTALAPKSLPRAPLRHPDRREPLAWPCLFEAAALKQGSQRVGPSRPDSLIGGAPARVVSARAETGS